MQKLRLCYAKRGRLRFTSHRDIARSFERALRRAGVPMAYSQGFSPHPRISWIGAAPTGVASEAEYVEIQLVERVAPAALRQELDAALPPGIDVLDVVEASSGSLAERIDASKWQIELPGVSAEQLADAVRQLLAAEHVEVERVTKDGRRIIDARAAIVELHVVATSGSEAGPQVGDGLAESAQCGILTAVVRQTTPVVRPNDVLSALRIVAGLTLTAPAKANRIAQGRLDDLGDLTDPLAPDREAAQSVPDAPR